MLETCENAFAKINLILDVLRKRQDGFHDIRTVMQSVSLCDTVKVSINTGKQWELSCDKTGIPTDEMNLAWKAAEVFFQALGSDPDGLTIHIIKRIPSEAGLAGGSADAAAVLRALNRLCGEPYSRQELAAIGATIGSDVPFCVIGGTARCEGKGERISPLTPMPDCCILVCKPNFSSSTPVLYRALDDRQICEHPDYASVEQALASGDLRALSRLVCNVFEPLVADEHSEIRSIRDICGEAGALGSQMTGSGSGVFAIFPDALCASDAVAVLESKGFQVFLTKPV